MLLNIGSTEENSIPANTKAIAKLIEINEIATKTGGTGLIAKHQIVAGPYKNEVVENFINIVNANPTAVQIGRKSLKEMARALGITELKSTEQLVNARKFMTVTIGVNKGNGQNEVKTWEPAAVNEAETEEPKQAKAADEDFPF